MYILLPRHLLPQTLTCAHLVFCEWNFYEHLWITCGCVHSCPLKDSGMDGSIYWCSFCRNTLVLAAEAEYLFTPSVLCRCSGCSTSSPTLVIVNFSLATRPLRVGGWLNEVIAVRSPIFLIFHPLCVAASCSKVAVVALSIMIEFLGRGRGTCHGTHLVLRKIKGVMDQM